MVLVLLRKEKIVSANKVIPNAFYTECFAKEELENKLDEINNLFKGEKDKSKEIIKTCKILSSRKKERLYLAIEKNSTTLGINKTLAPQFGKEKSTLVLSTEYNTDDNFEYFNSLCSVIRSFTSFKEFDIEKCFHHLQIINSNIKGVAASYFNLIAFSSYSDNIKHYTHCFVYIFFSLKLFSKETSKLENGVDSKQAPFNTIFDKTVIDAEISKYIYIKKPSNKTSFTEKNNFQIDKRLAKAGYLYTFSIELLDEKEIFSIYKDKYCIKHVFNIVKNNLEFIRAEVKDEYTLQKMIFAMLINYIKKCLLENRQSFAKKLTYNRFRKELDNIYSYKLYLERYLQDKHSFLKNSILGLLIGQRLLMYNVFVKRKTNTTEKSMGYRKYLN